MFEGLLWILDGLKEETSVQNWFGSWWHQTSCSELFISIRFHGAALQIYLYMASCMESLEHISFVTKRYYVILQLLNQKPKKIWWKIFSFQTISPMLHWAYPVPLHCISNFLNIRSAGHNRSPIYSFNKHSSLVCSVYIKEHRMGPLAHSPKDKLHCMWYIHIKPSASCIKTRTVWHSILQLHCWLGDFRHVIWLLWVLAFSPGLQW